MINSMLYYGALLLLLILISIADIKTYRIPDRYIIIGSIWAIVFNVIGRGIGIIEGLYGAIVGAAVILAISYFSLWIFKKPGMGGGDVKLMAMTGLFIGWRLTLLSILLAIYIAGLTSIILLIVKKIDRDDYLPFGPYLAIGIVLSILLGENIIDWYIDIFSKIIHVYMVKYV